MKYLDENAIKKLISLIKGDLATKQPTITASGLLKGDGAGTVTAADTQEATLVDVPNGLLKGDGTTISAAVAEIDYMAPPAGGTTGQILKKTETGTEWADTSVFIATYGTTTSAEIEAAYQAGKPIIAIYPGKVIQYQIFQRSGTTNHKFSTFAINGKFLTIQCVNDVWSDGNNSGVRPSAHASTHASGGSDPITPASIGAATMAEVNSAIQTAIGNAIGGSY